MYTSLQQSLLCVNKFLAKIIYSLICFMPLLFFILITRTLVSKIKTFLNAVRLDFARLLTYLLTFQNCHFCRAHKQFSFISCQVKNRRLNRMGTSPYGYRLMYCRTFHGLYGSTSCCVSQWPSQWGWANFDPHSSETAQSILMKFEP